MRFQRTDFSRLGLALLLAGAAWGVFAPARAGAQTIAIDKTATFDFWSYPFVSPGGGRPTASTFAAIATDLNSDGTSEFDNRDGQFGIGFTIDSALAGKPLDNYRIISAVITLTIINSVNNGGLKTYDPTYDSINTVTPQGTRTAGDDPGRPMELYGAGYRNGMTAQTAKSEGGNSRFSPVNVPQPQAGTRSIFPTDSVSGSLEGAVRDVSNNVTGVGNLVPGSAGSFESKPFSIGQVDGLVSGDLIPYDTAVTFTLDLSNPAVLTYLQLSLQQGLMMFMVNSLDSSSMMDPAGITIFATNENSVFAEFPRLELQVEIIPEPSSMTLFLCAAGVFGAGWRGRRLFGKPQFLS